MRRRRPRRSKGPVSASELAWALVRRHVPDEELRLLRVRQAWDRVATPPVAAQTWPTALRGGELSVAVHDSQWLHELAYLRQDLLARVRALVPAARVEALRLRLGAIPPRPQAPPTPSVPRPPALEPDPPSTTVEALREVGDPELREAAAAARLTLGRR